jgi:OPA family glycerol-3-phosphate transporter-like MFS transporter
VGLIDGMVYLGTGLQAFYYGRILPNGDAAKDPANWGQWPVAMIPLSLIGLLLALRIRKAHPSSMAKAKHEIKVPVTLTAEEAGE